MRARGFTLIEVLVALAIVAIGMAAVLEAMASSADTAQYLQSKTFAEWVALNRIETVRLSGAVPTAGSSNDTLEYAGRSWEWRQKVSPAKFADLLIPGMVQIEVDVRPADSKAGDDRGWYASATGFMGHAVQSSPAVVPPPWSNNPIVGPPAGTNPNTGTNPNGLTGSPSPP
jgi:general secretion pathway protein I